jgi:hypothetical protein
VARAGFGLVGAIATREITARAAIFVIESRFVFVHSILTAAMRR